MMEVQRPLCEPSEFDFGMPLDFLSDDPMLEALSCDIFSDCFLPLADDCLPPLPLPTLRPSALGCEEEGAMMVPLAALHKSHPHAAPLSGRGSASPTSSGTSYKASDAGGSCGSDCTEAHHSESPCHKSADSASPKVDVRIGKRKPDVDLDTIADVQERRKQRRLAKNRATAATSRARKREQMSHLAVRVAELEEQNARLQRALSARTRELAAATTALKPL